jgi:nucleotide-binding universal stress UspA family protein
MNGPIVVGTDGSATATQAVLRAIQLATAFDQTLHIVHAAAPQPLKEEALPPEFRGTVAANNVLDDVASRARQNGARVETHAVRGDAAEAILDVAEQVGADLIVVGNKGIGSAKRFVLGNVPSKVVHHSPCSTHVVHTS